MSGSGVHTGRVVKLVKRRRTRITSAAFRRMAIMQDSNSQQEVPKEFLETGRTGRRNALPDILLQQNASATTADLPDRLQQLTTHDPENPQPGPSTSRAGETKPEPEKKDGS